MATKIALLASLLALLPAQDPAEDAVTLAREMRKHLSSVEDSEVKLRLGEIVRQMGIRAGISLCGDSGDPGVHLLRLHDVRNLVARIKDTR